MIKEYQEEQDKPLIIDGEARKYMKAGYEPQFPVSFENLKTTDEIDAIIERYRQGRTDTNNEIKSIDDDIKDTNDYIIALKREIDEKGSNFSNLKQLRIELANMEKFKRERKNLEKEVDRYDYDLKNLDNNRNEILKQNALLNQQNREEVQKYEQSLASVNRNRLNLQQQPYESEYDYYKRLQEIEKEKYDPLLYKKYATNELTKKLKPKFNDLFDDKSFVEEIIKNLGDEDKYLINKDFDKVEKVYLDKYGFNNKSLNPKMAAQELINSYNKVKTDAITLLQSKMKRRPQREIYSDTIELSRDRKDLEARKAAAAEQANAASTLQARIKRRPQREIYSDTIELARDRQDLEARQAAAAAEAAARQAAASILQSKLKRRPQREIYSDTIELARDRQRLPARQAAAAAEAAAEAAASILQTRIKRRPAMNEYLLDRQDKRDFDYAVRDYKMQQARELQQERMGELAAQKIAKQRLSSALLRSKAQPELREIIDEKKTKEAKKQERKYLRNQELYLRDIEQRLPILERWLEHHQDIQDAAIAPQRELINREILANKSAATNIQKVLRGYKGRQQAKQRTQAERQEIEDAEREASKIREAATEQRKAKQAATNIQKVMRGYKGRQEYNKELSNIVDLEMEQQMQNLSDELEELSIAPTSLEELDFIKKEQAKLRKIRSDKGLKRSPYNTKMLKSIDAAIEYAKQKRADKLVEMSMQAAAEREPISPSSQVIQRLPNPVGRPRKKRNPRGRPPKGKGKDKDTQGAAGAGLKRIKPPKRQVRTNKEELMKNRLRLVASQIEAGNTNPRLIQEVNKLYKKLYDIDNAYMFLKK
jgi:hypothetical protein